MSLWQSRRAAVLGVVTVDDPSHNTGVRVSLPTPNCTARPSDCADIRVLNTLDGFNLQPRVSIPFSGAINVATVNSSNVFFLSLGDTLGGRGGQVIGINQVVWAPATFTLHAESDELLDQHMRYALRRGHHARSGWSGRVLRGSDQGRPDPADGRPELLAADRRDGRSLRARPGARLAAQRQVEHREDQQELVVVQERLLAEEERDPVGERTGGAAGA